MLRLAQLLEHLEEEVTILLALQALQANECLGLDRGVEAAAQGKAKFLLEADRESTAFDERAAMIPQARQLAQAGVLLQVDWSNKLVRVLALANLT